MGDVSGGVHVHGVHHPCHHLGQSWTASAAMWLFNQTATQLAMLRYPRRALLPTLLAPVDTIGWFLHTRCIRTPTRTQVAIIECLIAVPSVYLLGALNTHIRDGPQFAVAVVSSSALLLTAKFLYQRALAVAPLSLTIP